MRRSVSALEAGLRGRRSPIKLHGVTHLSGGGGRPAGGGTFSEILVLFESRGQPRTPGLNNGFLLLGFPS